MRIICEWNYVPDLDPLYNAQVIIGMSFGANHKNKGESPGVSNEEIARIIYRMSASNNIPVIAQREVAEAITKLKIPIQPVLVISENDNQSHITSYEVLCQAWQFCNNTHLRQAIIVAHPAHILRCSWVAEKIGFTINLPNVSSVPYEILSTQWWTRNRFFFFIWELYARIGWKFKGYL